MNPLGVWVECDYFHFLLVEFLTISHPRFYHKYILLLKAIQMQNGVPFSIPNWETVLGPTCNWGKIWIVNLLRSKLRHVVPWSVLFPMPQVWPNLDEPTKIYCKYTKASYFWPIQKSTLVLYSTCPLFCFYFWNFYHRYPGPSSFICNWYHSIWILNSSDMTFFPRTHVLD